MTKNAAVFVFWLTCSLAQAAALGGLNCGLRFHQYDRRKLHALTENTFPPN